jgi:molecular chaperone DnaK
MSVVGIDLGTTNTVVACVRGGRVHVLGDEQGRRLLPSVVSFHPNGDILVGHNAKARRAVDARNTIASVKRLLGRTWNSPELEKARRRFAFELKEGPGQGVLVTARGKEFTLPEIGAFVLRRAREIAEASLGERVERAVITVPAHFNELQRAATKVAGRVAGLEVLRILNEPTAAALAYGLGKGSKERIAIYDFGGGTFDATLLDLNGNVFEVLATAGDPFLGGDDIDDAIADRMADAFLVQHRYDPRQDGQAFERLRQAAEQLKMTLTTQTEAHVHLREIAFGMGGAHLDLSFGLSRAELERMTEPLVERTFRVTQDALALARLAPSEFDRTILVGGTSRMPIVRRRVEAFFGATPLDRMNPDEVVAIGAAIQAAALTDATRRRSIPAPPGFQVGQRLAPEEQTASSRFDEPPTLPHAQGSHPVLPPIGIDDDEETQAMIRDPSATHPGSPESTPSTRRGMPPPSAAAAPIPTTTAPLLPIPPPPATPRIPPAPRAPTINPPLPVPSAPPPSSAPLHPPAPSHSRSGLPPTGPQAFAPLARPFGTIEEPNSGSYSASFPRPAPPPAGAAPLAAPLGMPPPRTASVPPPHYISQPPPAPPHYISQPPPAPPHYISQPPPAPPHYISQATPPQQYLSQPPRPPVFTPSMPPPVLIDVTPRALVVETAGGFCDTVIPRNAQIPCERTRVFATAQDGQQVVRVRVAQGENPAFQGNTYLGEVELGGIPPAARGEVSVSVTFELDADGTLRVRASDTTTGRQATAQLHLLGVAAEQDIASMRQRMEQTGSIVSN